MNKKITISLGSIFAALIVFFIGFFLGKSESTPKIEKKTEIQWVKGDVIRDTIEVPAPVKTETPKDKPEFSAQDTENNSKVWDDYYLEKTYSFDFSNDTIGTFKVDALVKQNKLIRATSFVQPLTKTVKETETVYKAPTLSLWGVIGSSPDMKTNKIQIGATLKQKYILGVSGIRFDDKYSYTIDVGITF